MSSALPLRDRLQSTSPEPVLPRPTTPLRINKHPLSPPPSALSPRVSSDAQVQVARRSSSSFKHVRENNLVTKSPFRTRLPAALQGMHPSPRRVSGEKRPRPDSMHAQAENEKPFGFKRRQSKAFQTLFQTEPVTKSPFRRSSHSSSSSDPPPPLPPKPKPRPTTPSAIPVPSPVRGVLSKPQKMHGPRSLGQRNHQKHKTVTFDERCDVLEFSAGEEEVEEVFYDEDGYGYGYSYEQQDPDESMEDDFEMGSHIGDDSITGMVDSMLQATLPHTPPRPEDEEDVDLLPPSPSPAKARQASPIPPTEHQSMNSPQLVVEEHPNSQIKNEDPPFEDSFRSNKSNDNDSLDPANLSIGNSEVSISGLDHHSLLADTNFEGEVLTSASFVPTAGSSPRSRPISRSGSATPLDRSFERSLDRSFEARSTPSITPSRFNSPHSGSGSPFQRQLFKPPSTSSLGSVTNRRGSSLTRELIHERMRRKSEEALRSENASPAPPPVDDPRDEGPPDPVNAAEDEDDSGSDANASRDTVPADEQPAPTLPLMVRNQNPTHDGVMSIDPEPQPIDPPRPTLQERAHSIDVTSSEMDVKRAFAGLDLDFEHGFGLGEEGMSVSAGLGIGMGARAKHSSMHLGDVSALDKLMEDMAQGVGVGAGAAGTANTSIVSEGQSYASLRVEAVTEGVKTTTFSLPDIVRDHDGIGIDLGIPAPEENIPMHGPSSDSRSGSGSGSSTKVSSSSVSPSLPAVPAKDAIRAREELIKAKKREARMREDEDLYEDSDMGSPGPAMLSPRAVGNGLPTRRRSMSTGDAETIVAQRQMALQRKADVGMRDENLLDITALRGEDAPLADTINRELKKRENMKRSKYHVREHSETIYASADASRLNGPKEINTGKAWRSIRRPSDMNEHAKQLRDLREQQQKNGKAHGKVFVKVVGLRGLNVPIPVEPTQVTCTLNNGIHFVTTPETALGRDCNIDQEFELIEHSKLEFTLTIKVRKDRHIQAQMKANQAPPVQRPPPQPAPPPPSKGGGMRFLWGSPKKSKVASRAASPAPPPQPAPAFRLQENLARYMKQDCSLGRAFITFKDIAPHCDTRLMETSFPLIGQKLEVGSTGRALQIGEIVLQIFRLPPLPGIPPEQLPQSLEECHRGLTHTRWHKSCYMQGTLTQIGGDCTTWRRRHLRIIGCSLVAYNDVTRRAIASIDLRKATRVEDESSPVRSPASAATARSGYDDDDPYGVGSVERSFRLELGNEQILFYADTDQEKEDWLKILQALIGRVPPNPLWAELLFQRQEQAKNAPPSAGPSSPPAHPR